MAGAVPRGGGSTSLAQSPPRDPDSAELRPAKAQPRADVVIPVYRGVAMTVACVEAVLRHSGDALSRLFLVDDCGPEPEMRPALRALRDREPRVRLLENEQNLGFVASCNRGLSLADRDVVVLNSDTRVTAGWLEELLGVLDESDRIGAVTPLSNNATLCSVPDFGRGAPPELLEGVALPLDGIPRWTEVPTGVGFCLLLRKQLLDLVGPFDPVYGRGYNEENDWCQRVQALGFVIARANRALVIHLGQVSFGDARDELDVVNARRLVARYPHYLEQNRSFERGPEARVAAIAVASALRPLRVCLDASHLTTPAAHGPSAATAALARALREDARIHLTVRVANDELARSFGAAGLATVPAGAPLSGYELVHRPTPVETAQALGELLEAEGHLVFTWQGFADSRSPMALPSWGQVEELRAVTWAALQAAQGVIASSRHAGAELRHAFGLAEADIHLVPQGGAEPAAPSGEAIAMVRRRYGLDGAYVVCAAGDSPPENLQLLLEGYALLSDREGGAPPPLLLLGPPSQTRKGLHGHGAGLPAFARWLGELPPEDALPLVAGAAAAVFPSGCEGGALPALVAMGLGVPLVANSLGAMPELVGDHALLVHDFTPSALATQLQLALVAGPAVRQRVERAKARAAQFTWKNTAAATVEAYLKVAQAPRASSLAARQALALLLRRHPARAQLSVPDSRRVL